MNESMWRKIRMASGKTQVDVACDLGLSKQAINAFEKGRSPMPTKVQIYYLGLRNSKTDKIIIDYLREGIK